MQLTLQRKFTIRDTTLGELFLDGVKQCDTLEDVIREVPGQPVETWKIHGRTAIPVGTYLVYLANSPKFGPDTLSLEDVPGFTYIRIHAGNDDADTEGCILVGTAVADPSGDGGNVVSSRDALLKLRAKLLPVIRSGERVHLTVKNP